MRWHVWELFWLYVSESKEDVASERNKTEKHEHHEDAKEVLYLLLACLFSIIATLAIVSPSDIIPSEIQRKERWENAKAHDEGTSIISSAASTSVSIWFRFSSLPLWASGYVFRRVLLVFLSGIFIVLSCVYWDNWFGRDAALAYGANQGVGRLLHPRIYAWPAIQMTTLAHDRLFSCI